MADYRRHNVHILQARQDLTGLRVLEIGGNPRGGTARMLLECGAREVVVTNRPGNARDVRIDEQVELRIADARLLHEVFPPESFDAAFGVAVAEHIPEPEAWTASLARVLKPGATAVVQGGPIWSGPRGHHVWVSIDGRDYHFSKPGNPLDAWDHLLHDESGLIEKLVRDKGLSLAHAMAIGAWVYRSPEMNRIPFSALLKGMGASGMNVVDVVENIHIRPDATLKARLADSPLGPDERYEISGATFILRAAG